MSNERIRIGPSITLEYPEGKVGLLRGLMDPNQSPGPTKWTCAVVLDEDKKLCYFKILEHRVPDSSEINDLREYFKSLGYRLGNWERAKNGKELKQVSVR